MSLHETIHSTLAYWVDLYGLEAIRKELETFEDFERPETAGAIRAHLLADLATWPQVFQRHLRSYLERCTADPQRARLELRNLESWRASPAERSVSSCACGCNGVNSNLGRYLVWIREAAAEMRAAPTPRKKANRRRDLAWNKEELLEWLWRTGQRRIDRLALGQHAVEAAKGEVEHLLAEIKRRNYALHEARERLAAGVYRKGKRHGQPLLERHRLIAESVLEHGRAAVQGWQARIRELERLVAEDVPRLVRQYTGCAREAATEEPPRRRWCS